MTGWSDRVRLASLAVVHDVPNPGYIMHKIFAENLKYVMHFKMKQCLSFDNKNG